MKVERVQLAPVLLQAKALVAQLEALLAIPETTEEPNKCPRCGETEFAEAGDVQVCAGCNANLREGVIVG